ncbi:hypothetical protein LEP1GSC161_1731 [Leptospira santarosai str. CBC1416]|uniref:Uncharacterized protein n=5 Tax=Leptospira santarosai TaxID=28183 RepID=M6V844_9LEPT|nr:hypothetical protein LEP1GSC179_3557 [Leptospira santarosai str. MOR084]EKT85280.1 hypothetical protein LSS_18364 [Leptospira santarosai serovar Shermani str. LT 821]EMJ49394.1 hypothetical protein LEP1GSC169_1187 [Leptospira santarosai str. HAI1349]EMM85912.1 hypothetical protein LEP1GSC039_1798 [Leptospira santarosai str. 2000027870]EMN22792.1 hypothetical protein LEP1GSC063_1820 [Leptospira santarosai serovar Arenal str. MAVJ 401]EMO16101.1 hypothetical protein LEP1GSC165_3155 [Leptospir
MSFFDFSTQVFLKRKDNKIGTCLENTLSLPKISIPIILKFFEITFGNFT